VPAAGHFGDLNEMILKFDFPVERYGEEGKVFAGASRNTKNY
jgi:hypothetical protein